MEGAALGALSGAGAEVIAEGLAENLIQDVLEEETEKAQRENRPLNPQDYFNAVEARIQSLKDVTQLGIGVGAMLAKQNVTIATTTADNALSHNFAPLLVAAAGVAITAVKISWEVASIVYDDEIEATKQDVAKAVGERLNVEPLYVEHTIDAMMMAGSLTQALKKGGKLILKKVTKAETKTAEKVVKTLPAPGDGKGASKVVRKDRNMTAPLDKEGKWPSKPGKEWRDKITGKAQHTGQNDAHAVRSYREGIRAAKREDVDKVYLNRGYKKATDHPIDPNRRPDVTVVRKDGKVDAIEVRSKTDDRKELVRRNQEAINQLPDEKKGRVRVIEPSSEVIQ